MAAVGTWAREGVMSAMMLWMLWTALAPGVDYANFTKEGVQVVRVDPSKARLKSLHASAADKTPRTAGKWCDEQHLVAAINLGMYLDDHLSNVGHAHAGAHVNQARWNSKYQSVLAFGPKKKGIPAALMVDLDAPTAKLEDYENVIQNLRLVRAPGHNVWTQQPRRWSEAAVALDKKGNVLFLFSRAPHTMFDFNQLILSMPLEITHAMHVEGGPEASLSLRGAVKLDLNGSFETGFIENESISQQWAIPNVLGVAAP
jgi:uncharacterized protein YigE (DUF2233 family)